jgi:hypothetical protein
MGGASGAGLFRGIPGRLKLKRQLTPPPAPSKAEARDIFRNLAERNTTRHAGDLPFLRTSKVKARIRC